MMGQQDMDHADGSAQRQRNLRVMLAIILIVGLGEELWVRFLPAYLEELGGGVWVVAAYGTIYNLLDAAYQYPGGWLADRLGRRRALILFTLAASAGYLLYLVGPSWEWVLVGTFLVMAWDSLTLPALYAIVGDNLPPQRRAAGFAWQSLVRRLPTIMAPPLGGLFIVVSGLALGVRVGLGITVALCLLVVPLVGWFYQDNHVRSHAPVPIAGVWRGRGGQLKRLLLADILSRWAEGIPKVFVILYCMNELGLSAFLFGWLMTIQRVTNVLVYLTLAARADRLNRKLLVLVTFLFFALFPLVLVNATCFAGAVVAFVVAGLWEIGEPARKAIIVDLSGEERRGQAVGLYYLARNLAVFPAALVGGLLWKTLGPGWVFYSAFIVGMVGFTVYAVPTPFLPGERGEGEGAGGQATP